MWFDELMDDCKQALALVTTNIWIPLPYVLHALISGVGFFLLSIALIAMLLITAFGSGYDQEASWLILALALLGVIALTALISSILKALAEAGSIHLFAAVAAGNKPSASLFWTGVRQHFFSMWGISLLLNALVVLLLPILAVLGILAMAAGIISAGWAFVGVGALIAVFLSAWPMALVLDKQGGLKALAAGFRLGRHYFGGMFVLALAATLLGRYLSASFGPLVTILIGWILAVVIRSWHKMTILLIYKRRREAWQYPSQAE